MPKIYIISGPNGSGKTTSAGILLKEVFKCREYVNADEIAKGISPLNPSAEDVAFQAGRVMLQRIKNLIENKKDFAFETTLATRSYAPLLKAAKKKGYEVHLIFLWLESVGLAKKRVKIRVANGGHMIPHEIIERRYKRGIKNLFGLYMPIADSWRIFDNSGKNLNYIAKNENKKEEVFEDKIWKNIRSVYENKN